MSNCSPTLIEVVEIVDDINSNMPERLFDLGVTPLIVKHVSYCGFGVYAFNTRIWSEENDDRGYMVDEQGNEIDEKEGLKEYLKNKIEDICEMMLEGIK